MSSVNVNVRLRPVRFGFLVKPSDESSIIKIMQVNTVLWGGIYNPIIPFFKSVPKWWDKYFKGYTAKQIIKSYLDYFEPDFIVEAEPGLAENIGYNPERVISLSNVLAAYGDEARFKSYGLTANHIYHDLYKKEFQFVHKVKPKIIKAHSLDKKLKLFTTCIFGDFPQEEEHSYLEANYDSVFDPESIEANAKNLSSFYKGKTYSPLYIANSKIDVRYYSSDDIFAPTLFVINANKPRDIIDYWNLRAIRKNIIVVPKQWLEEMSDFCRDFILNNHRPLTRNSKSGMVQPIALFSRSINEKEAKELFGKYIQVDKKDANTIQLWFPPFWMAGAKHSARNLRPLLIAEEEATDIIIDKENAIKFKTLSPSFLQIGCGNEYRWANVVNLKDYSKQSLLATVFPNEYQQYSYPRLCLGKNEIIPSVEGLVIFQMFDKISEHWQLMTGEKAFKSWFEKKNIMVQFSQSGKATKQIIETIGGVKNLWIIASKSIINLLNDIACSENKAIRANTFKNQVNHSKNKQLNEFMENRQFEMLVNNNVVQLGLEVECNFCEKRNWYSLQDIKHAPQCAFCLNSYTFPICNPDKDTTWSYKVTGPFSLEKYAEGGYATVLAIRFFGNVFSSISDANITWASGVKLRFEKKEEEIEADFLIWYQKRMTFQLDFKPQLLIGEAKSFGSFKKIDVERMRYLAEQFPGSFLVFSIMKNELTKKEIVLIQKLAKWGRKFLKNGKDERQANIIILTGVELFAEGGLSETWRNIGEKQKNLAEFLVRCGYDLETLADITQQLYLNMPSYSDDFNAIRKKA